MKISTKGRYALRLMIELAKFDQSSPVRLKELAERQNISEKYAEQIIGLMRRGGVVSARRGTQGGYDERKYSCATYHLWEKLKESINSVVDHITIADLAEMDRVNLNEIMMGAGI